MTNSRPVKAPYSPGGKSDLPARITKAASKQTYYTIRFLVDRERVQDAYRAYAYYRWVDDRLDTNTGSRESKLTFLNRQREILEACYRQEPYPSITPEEQMLVELIAQDREKYSCLQFYLRNMMAVMSFDVERKGRWITNAELNHYSRLLAMAVTEALFYFIGHSGPYPSTASRYQAVYGAHIAHMLRDMHDDIQLGYINLPAESLKGGNISLSDMNSEPFRKWVLERTRVAKRCFQTGKKYLSQVRNVRFRLAAFTYLARFEWMIRLIERDGYCLRRTYPERRGIRAAFWMGWRVFRSALNIPILEKPAG
jgi:phytoene/squalene synthetase